MLRPAPWLASLVLLPLLLAGCKDPETVAQATRTRTAEERMTEGARLLEQGRADLALPELKEAAAVLTADPRPRLLIARAQSELGNEGASILALKEAVELSRSGDPGLKKQLADALLADGHLEQAVSLLVELRDAGTLSAHETLQLARLQTRLGDTHAAFKTLEEVQRKNPDDPDAKVTEAEILLASEDQKHQDFAVKILDRLAAENPQHAPTRAVRARRLLGLGEVEPAAAELAALPEAQLQEGELAELHADVLAAQERFEEADSTLGRLLEERPRDPELLSRLAEVKLNLGAVSTADMLVEQALGRRPKNARSLYMRGRIMEAQGELSRAQEYYGQALQSDRMFAPALARSWKIHQHQNETTEAMSALERLLFMNKAGPDDKIALAELYADTKTQTARGLKLIDEAIRRDPKSDRLREIQAKLKANLPRKKRTRPQVEIISGGKRRR